LEDRGWFLLRSLLWFFWEELVGGLSQGAPGLLGILGSGARKPQGFLELGSWRGSVPSWLGGKDSVFRQFQAVFRQLAKAVSNNKKEKDKLLLQEVFYQY
jgi:hypothetical protein